MFDYYLFLTCFNELPLFVIITDDKPKEMEANTREVGEEIGAFYMD